MMTSSTKSSINCYQQLTWFADLGHLTHGLMLIVVQPSG
jgi:hypothetical protein